MKRSKKEKKPTEFIVCFLVDNGSQYIKDEYKGHITPCPETAKGFPSKYAAKEAVDKMRERRHIGEYQILRREQKDPPVV